MQGVFKAIYSIQKLVNFKATISVSCSFGNQYRCLDIKTLLNFFIAPHNSHNIKGLRGISNRHKYYNIIISFFK